MPVGLKGKVYRMVIGLAVLHRSECWPIKKTRVQRLMVIEMRMIGWMYGCTIMDRICNGEIRDLVKVALTEDKMREIRFRWFCHMKRRSMDALIRKYERINIPKSKRGRGRPKKSMEEVIREDLKVVGLIEDMTHDRRL